MGRRPTIKKTSAVDHLVTPVNTPGIPNRAGSESPKVFEFDFHKLTPSTSAKKKKNDSSGGGGGPSLVFMQPTDVSSPLKGMNTISDLKDFASSGLQSIKRQLDRSHSEFMKDVDSSHSRLQKRFKMQSQGRQQVIDEAERELKKLSDRNGESLEAIKTSFNEFMVEAQSRAARLLKTTIPEISESFEKSINALRTRYGISATSAS